MRAWVVGLAVVLAACGSDPATEATTTSAPPAAAAPDLGVLRSLYAGTSREAVLDDLAVEVMGDIVRISTSLYRDAEAGPIGLGLCLNVKAAGAQGEVQVLGSDGGVIASTREGICQVRV